MNAYDDKNQNPENTHEAEEASVPAESGTEIAELSNEAMDGLIAEIASEEVKENKNNPSGQKQGAAQATQKKRGFYARGPFSLKRTFTQDGTTRSSNA